MSQSVKNLAEINHKLTHISSKMLLPKHSSPHIIVVTKHHPASSVRPLLENGHRIFGENKVQEAQQKWGELKHDFPDTELHLIGALQTNKVADALMLFDVIHTVDREKLAKKIADEAQKLQRFPKLFIQVNTGEEEQKSGISPKQADEFIQHCLHALNLPVIGLMCVPPVDEPAGLHFALLRDIAARHQLPHLSMGMSSDFEIATAMGATYLRIGTAIMGEREQ